MSQYGTLAKLAAAKAQQGMQPPEAWKTAAFEVFPTQKASRGKGCPRCDFLGLAAEVLRIFRDEHLLRSRFGCVAVECYYKLAPRAAVIVSACPMLARFLRLLIDVLVGHVSSLNKRSGRPRRD